jgi:hypothetical protein
LARTHLKNTDSHGTSFGAGNPTAINNPRERHRSRVRAGGPDVHAAEQSGITSLEQSRPPRTEER